MVSAGVGAASVVVVVSAASSWLSFATRGLSWSPATAASDAPAKKIVVKTSVEASRRLRDLGSVVSSEPGAAPPNSQFSLRMNRRGIAVCSLCLSPWPPLGARIGPFLRSRLRAVAIELRSPGPLPHSRERRHGSPTRGIRARPGATMTGSRLTTRRSGAPKDRERTFDACLPVSLGFESISPQLVLVFRFARSARSSCGKGVNHRDVHGSGYLLPRPAFGRGRSDDG